MDVGSYLENVLSQYPLNRIYIRAGIELQKLTDDGIIKRGEVRYKRSECGERDGVIVVWQQTMADIHTQWTDEVQVNANTST